MFKIEVKIYNTWIYVYVDKVKFKRKTKVKDNDFDGYTVDCVDGIYMYIPEEYDEFIIAHECIHAGWYILENVGVDLDVDNHEALAYLVMYLMKEIKKEVYEKRN
jgi:hypothetical protein